jgi:3',5'-cyclic AMP phosphodiesterase CpdA
MSSPISQVRILHFSDLHFDKERGRKNAHRFEPEAGTSYGQLSGTGVPTLLQSIRSDWDALAKERGDGGGPLETLVAITGDLTEHHSTDEFGEAYTFLHGLTSSQTFLSSPLSPPQVYLVPGNHDVDWDQPQLGGRWERFISFYQRVYRDLPGRQVYPDEPRSLNRVFFRAQEPAVLIVELNSCLHIQEHVDTAMRGEIDPAALAEVRDALDAIPQSDRDRALRLALVHHHPVLIPAFGEPGRDYDAIDRSIQLFTVLRDYGFHLILHGHKHYPHTFTYDPACAWTTEPVSPIMIVAGGSAGSNGLPDPPNATNTYNIITAAWNRNANTARIRVETRGLRLRDRYGRPLLEPDWHWYTLRDVDQTLVPRQPYQGMEIHRQAFDPGPDGQLENQRRKVYAELRGNMPVVELVPALRPGFAYEARVRIADHGRSEAQIPTEVVWSAGDKFPQMFRCTARDNPEFRAAFGYRGPMLIQARMQFADGQVRLGHVYAELPTA